MFPENKRKETKQTVHEAYVAESSTSLIYVTAFRHTAEEEQIEGQGGWQVKRSVPVDYLSTGAFFVSSCCNWQKEMFPTWIVNVTMLLYTNSLTQPYQQLMTSYIFAEQYWFSETE